MKLILRPFKLLLAGILTVLVFVIDQLAKVYAIVLTVLLFVLVISIIVTIVEQSWYNLPILGGILLVAFLVIIFAAAISGTLVSWRDRLLGRY
jgi:hypothetical protein